ncbi:MAG: site-specific DNA-methyltransferase [Nocardioides sp.]
MAWNRFIEGDNLPVLHNLARAGQEFDLVYIDPPYNTGSALVYADTHRGSDGRRAGRHQAWLEMIRPRLEAAREVMSAGAAIFVSIDDNEAARLRLCMDEVFGEANFLAQIVVNLNPKGRQLGDGFALNHEYVLAYAKRSPTCVLQPSTTQSVQARDFPKVAADGRRFRLLPLRNTNKKFNPVTSPTLHFVVYGDPTTGRVSIGRFEGASEIRPVFGDGTPAVWRWSAPLIAERPDDLVCRVVAGRLGKRIDVFQRDWMATSAAGDRRKKVRTIWMADEIGSTDAAVAEVKALVGKVFDSPKPTGLVLRLLEMMPPDARVLDFFAGSGTTGHAVAVANRMDSGERTCVSVNSAEPTPVGSNARALGFATVADITRARLRAVAETVGGGLDLEVADAQGAPSASAGVVG